MPSRKIAVTVRAELMDRVERFRRRSGETRSAVVARALSDLLKAEQQTERIRRYQQAYREIPETTEDVALADQLAAHALRHAPAWDET